MAGSPPPRACGWAAGPRPRPGIAGLLADARRANTLPEFEPGTILFNRLWPLALLAVAAGALGFFFPPVPAVAVGYALLVALLWRKQSAAVEAIEGRDGVEFWIDRTSPFGPPRLLRLPGMRKIEPEDEAPVRSLSGAYRERLRSLSSCFQVRVFATWAFVSHARRAVATP